MGARVTFPHMGTLYIPVRALLERLGLEVVVPPRPTRRTLSLGVESAPEFACLPLKINLGNYREAAELGAETIIMAGGVGPCRFGYYAQVQREILRDLGYSLEMVVLEPPQGNLLQLYRALRRLLGRLRWSTIKEAVQLAWCKAVAADSLERVLQAVRAVEPSPGQADLVYRRALVKLDQAADVASVRAVAEEGRQELLRLAPADAPPPLRIALVGEIYTLLEPFSNLELERHLGRLGVQVVRQIFLTHWIQEHLVPRPWRPSGEELNPRELAFPYLRHFVGGHGLETIAHSVYFSRQRVDGVIQVAPLTCMPEIVAEAILPQVSRELDLPVLTLFFDEHSAEAGLLTRLEAFVDLVRRRKASRRKGRVKGQ
ncbi:MAG: CoA protein activase [Bacillota bacterium]|nr:CoA protein activase [Bacillota bacterium]